MRLKRLISCLLSAALLAGLLVFPPASASGSGGFSDISDSTVADAAEMLRLLGVVDGTGGPEIRRHLRTATSGSHPSVCP